MFHMIDFIIRMVYYYKIVLFTTISISFSVSEIFLVKFL